MIQFEQVLQRPRRLSLCILDVMDLDGGEIDHLLL